MQSAASRLLGLALGLGLVLIFASAAPASATRILVMPLSNDADATMSGAVGRALEAAVQDAVPTAAVITSSTLGTAVELEAARNCLGGESGMEACLTEIVDAANAELVVRGHLGVLGDTLVLTVSVLDGPTARLLSQGQRLVPRDTPSDLVAVSPELVREVLGQSRAVAVRAGPKAFPTALVATTVVGASVGVLGLGALGTWAIANGEYQQGRVNREQARTFEGAQAPLLLGGAAGVLVGGAVAVVAGAFAVRSLAGENP